MAIVLLPHLPNTQPAAHQAAIALQSTGHQTYPYPWTPDLDHPWQPLLTTTQTHLSHFPNTHPYLILCLPPTPWPHWITWQQITTLATQFTTQNITLIPAPLPSSPPADHHWIQDLITLIQLNESTQYLSHFLQTHHISEDELLSQFKYLRQQAYSPLAAS